MSVRRFEFVGGRSYKFWEIERDGSVVRIRWGRIGTQGQSQTKDLHFDWAAKDFVGKKIQEKFEKGYRETTKSKAARTEPYAKPKAPAKKKEKSEEEKLRDRLKRKIKERWGNE